MTSYARSRYNERQPSAMELACGHWSKRMYPEERKVTQGFGQAPCPICEVVVALVAVATSAAPVALPVRGEGWLGETPDGKFGWQCKACGKFDGRRRGRTNFATEHEAMKSWAMHIATLAHRENVALRERVSGISGSRETS